MIKDHFKDVIKETLTIVVIAYKYPLLEHTRFSTVIKKHRFLFDQFVNKRHASSEFIREGEL